MGCTASIGQAPRYTTADTSCASSGMRQTSITRGVSSTPPKSSYIVPNRNIMPPHSPTQPINRPAQRPNPASTLTPQPSNLPIQSKLPQILRSPSVQRQVLRQNNGGVETTKVFTTQTYTSSYL